MKKTYADVVQQIEALKAEAEDLKQAEVAAVVARIKEAIGVYGLTATDLFPSGAKRGRPVGSKKRVAIRNAGPKGSGPERVQKSYSDGAGNTWGGRGPRPAWIKEALAAGKNLSDFAV